MTNNITVFARAFDRKTGKRIVDEAGKSIDVRAEEINLDENELFKGCSTILDIKKTYESFWNTLNPYSKEIIFVQEILVK